MTFLCDEGVESQVVQRLRAEGHEVQYVAEMEPGIEDTQVLERARAGGALLVTGDKDFGELVYRQGRAVAGVVLLRLGGLEPEAKAEVVAKTVRDHGAELVGAFSVLDSRGVRIRRLP